MKFALPALLAPDRQADRVVPPSGFTAQLTLFTAAAMAFLAVFALALSLASGRLADRWASALAGTATIRISAPPEQLDTQVAAVLALLATTPGIDTARALDTEEQRALLEPWFGPDLPVEALPLPRLIELTEARPGYDSEGLRLRLAAEAPGAVLDDHTRWRRPMAQAAERLRLLGALSLILIAGSTAAMITLAANSALSANLPVIRVLRLVGAKDAYIVRAFVRRFTLRALSGAAIGTVLAMTLVALLPRADEAGAFLTGLGFQGFGWLLPLLLPPVVAVLAFAATRAAAFRTLKGLT
ncbi:cell division protein FtsX [Pseudotabrizicola sediminis]|uniref:Cell division protein FtsX n=1 Tax=Pseudotabrizicola sediminis TaxID=2486418 RepID=A0ABY2KPJ2_9RHOB|nr:cell division protein FtsX [Pseudotabrizicola sediminis]TGD44593.1 cell division protein FtsX [Pseudotabrizicola sediminis]